MEIKPICPFKLRALAPLAKEFYASSKLLRTFDIEKFVTLWRTLIQSDQGVIFAAFDGHDIVGAIGGTKYPEAYCQDFIAQEFFWFVSRDARGTAGIRLYRAFEHWSREQGCAEIRMGHLTDLMPEKVAAFYRRIGFVPVETNYAKRLAS